MKLADFRARVEAALRTVGFEKYKQGFGRQGEGVWTMVEVEKVFGKNCAINVAFWLDALAEGSGERSPPQHDSCHLFYRLERLFPAHHTTIVTAGMADEPEQPAEYERLAHLLAGEIGEALRDLGTDAGLRAAMAAGRLQAGLVKKEARQYLTSEGA